MSSQGLVAWVFLALVSGALGAEVVAWSPPLQRTLLRWAAQALPEPHQARYLEEWLAELEETPNGPLTRLLWVAPIVAHRRSMAVSLGAPPAGLRYGSKRVLDLVVAACALVFLAPVLAPIALMIKLDSSGPVFFRQVRVGRGGEEFAMLKFRSMVTDAEQQLIDLRDRSEGNGVPCKRREDPRITRLGKVLRRYSLDELPQLINVALGQMSLVGPRPSLAVEVALHDDDVRRRLLVKPGLTGLWQINGRSHLDWNESVRLDLRYVENWSFSSDFWILWKTFGAVVRGRGAY